MEIKRGDMYYADLHPVIGSEQGGVRPVVVIQNNVGNHYSPTVIVAAITGRNKKGMPTHVNIHEQPGLRKTSVAMLEQIRTVDRERLQDYIGQMDKQTMHDIDQAIAVSFGLDHILKSQEYTEEQTAEKDREK